MPSEDYYRTLMIQAIGRALNVATPMIDTLLLRYETTVKQYCDTFTSTTIKAIRITSF